MSEIRPYCIVSISQTTPAQTTTNLRVRSYLNLQGQPSPLFMTVGNPSPFQAAMDPGA